MTKPVLSIGIIFKNEIRCLERCLQSLKSLRYAVPCEVVMADTGSTDGSREVAERYADTLIDFTWIDDFAAARNAVMNRCSGRWFMFIDADEWLAEDIDELLKFLRGGRADAAFVIVRNYTGAELSENYQDARLIRLVRMSKKLRFVGAIHEHWEIPSDFSVSRLSKTILYHDGYVGLNNERGKPKRERNMALLRKELERNPEDLRTILQCIESSRPEPDHIDYIRMGLEGVERKSYRWKMYGPAILRYAVVEAYSNQRPELEEWAARAEELFPKSFFTRIDVVGMTAMHYWRTKKYEKCIQRCEQYMVALEEYHNHKEYGADMVSSTLIMSTTGWEWKLRDCLMMSCVKERRLERALDCLELQEPKERKVVVDIIDGLERIHTRTNDDTAPLLLRFYAWVNGDKTSTEDIRFLFAQAAARAFSAERRKEDKEREAVRPSYTLYLPLAGQCEVGTAAAIMKADSVQEMDGLLNKVEKWGEFPITALGRALSREATFPPSGKLMDLKEMDTVAKRLVQLKDTALVGQAAKDAAKGGQQLAWAWRLVLAAVDACKWTDEAQGMALSQCFVQVERQFLSTCYTPVMLQDDWAVLLPPVHRFGSYCAQAFDILENGDAAGCVRLLRAGLKVCPEMKPMVEFLTEHTPELQGPPPSQELLELARQVRTMLAAYPPDDPAVAALKASPVYQKVAHLIEGEKA